MNRAEELALLLKPVNKSASIVGARNLFGSGRPDSPRQLDQRSNSPMEITITRHDSNPASSQSVIYRSRASSSASSSAETAGPRPGSSELSNSFQDCNMGITSIDFQQALSNQSVQNLGKNLHRSNAASYSYSYHCVRNRTVS